MLQTLSECAVTLKMIHLKRVKTKHSVWKHSTPTELVLDFILFLFKGPEFIQFLQQEYLPSLHVSPEISQVNMETINGPWKIWMFHYFTKRNSVKLKMARVNI